MIKKNNKSKKALSVIFVLIGAFMATMALFIGIFTGRYNISLMILGSGFIFFSLSATPEYALRNFSDSRKVQFSKKSKNLNLVAGLMFALSAFFYLIKIA